MSDVTRNVRSAGRGGRAGLAAWGWVLLAATAAAAEPEVIPHHQSKPPGPALSPEEALQRMQVPPGFKVELVASEPDLVNPVAMTFDERGRIWVTESFEYPRSEPGPGRDRIKVLEDTDHDGRVDRVSIFAEGLNIPSGIAVGHGGVWVANAPDILFLQDTDGDGRADRREVVVTGFGRTDTHELPNSLTWGPDGWLYGLNGVFNHCQVTHRGREYRFNCALFRIHPQTRDFELFCEGTSNPWGIAWDTEGSAFISACVIDHLWHLVETGYYHRQGGPYPPFTWKIESIVDYRHQMAAYCGIHYFDSDAYPPEYRESLYMGNIHGNCVNRDVVERRGATYRGRPRDDFLVANDAWFMPVVQKTGPDGCLYVLDWYDRYHCYQDARRDPAGIDRGKGRLYRVRYGDAPRAGPFDLAGETDEQLLARLGSPNVFFRDLAQRILGERLLGTAPGPARSADERSQLVAKLEALVMDASASRKARLHALWARVGGGQLGAEFIAALAGSDDSTFRAWAVRAVGNARKADAATRERVLALAADPSPDVRLQVAIAVGKLAAGESPAIDPLPVWLAILATAGDDPLLARVVWANLQPRLGHDGPRFVEALGRRRLGDSPAWREVVPRALDRMWAEPTMRPEVLARGVLDTLGGEGGSVDGGRSVLAWLAAKLESGELKGERADALRAALVPELRKRLEAAVADDPLRAGVVAVAASWRDDAALAVARSLAADGSRPAAERAAAFEALVTARDPAAVELFATALDADDPASAELPRRALVVAGRLDAPEVARAVLAAWGRLDAGLQPLAVELLSSRAAWALALLEAIEAGRVPREALGVNQVRNLLASRDPRVVAKVEAVWGKLRKDRNPQREQIVAEMRSLVTSGPGDPVAGQAAFHKLCGQCHKIHGVGQEVGPDITVNGRGNLEQLLSNVFDPSLVIGRGYQARVVLTTDGRVVTGLVVEEGPQRVVLKVQGGKLETLARGDIEEMETSPLSLMPEGVERQLAPREIVDLFAFLALDKPPSDPAARPIAGFYAAPAGK